MTEPVFNPLDIENLGAAILRKMLEREPRPLGGVGGFRGAGVYAVYYTGSFPAYSPLVELNTGDKFEAPIYVGKAVPSGARKGLQVVHSGDSTALSARLAQHARSVAEVGNLGLDDFWARWIVTDSIWIPLAESLLITGSAPVWNSVVDGFGNHDPGAGRVSGQRSRWDTLHPGRPWAKALRSRSESAQAIEREVAEHLRSRFQA